MSVEISFLIVIDLVLTIGVFGCIKVHLIKVINLVQQGGSLTLPLSGCWNIEKRDWMYVVIPSNRIPRFKAYQRTKHRRRIYE